MGKERENKMRILLAKIYSQKSRAKTNMGKRGMMSGALELLENLSPSFLVWIVFKIRK